MAISKDLLEMLVCPVCKVKVRLKTDESGFNCQKCHRTYLIVDEIPKMLADEAIIEELPETSLK
ncbi:MAG: Trm112 family protein [Blastocatellia bacterium]